MENSLDSTFGPIMTLTAVTTLVATLDRNRSARTPFNLPEQCTRRKQQAQTPDGLDTLTRLSQSPVETYAVLLHMRAGRLRMCALAQDAVVRGARRPGA